MKDNSTITIREKILDEAKRCVSQDRNLAYGGPEDNFGIIADLWNPYLVAITKQGVKTLRPHDIAAMNILQKISRVVSSPMKEDHWVDIAGYAACGGECANLLLNINPIND